MMKEAEGDLWEWRPKPANRFALVITTNGTLKRNGKAVMGKGCAKEALQQMFKDDYGRVRPLYPDLDKYLGEYIAKFGNKAFRMKQPEGSDLRWSGLYTFPTKHNWWERADPQLIEQSAKQLVKMVTKDDVKHVVIPRPGCGLGDLRWEEVKPILEPILDDRFTIITFKER